MTLRRISTYSANLCSLSAEPVMIAYIPSLGQQPCQRHAVILLRSLHAQSPTPPAYSFHSHSPSSCRRFLVNLEADKLLTVFLITVCCSSLQPSVLIILMMIGRQCEMYSAAATPCVNSSPFLPIFCEIGLPLLPRFFVRNFSVTCHRCVADEICLSCSSVTR